MGWDGKYTQTANAKAASSSSDLTLAFPSNVTAGNLMVVPITWYNTQNPTITISDTFGSTWNHVGHTNADAASGCDVYWAFNAAGGANTLTFHSGTALFKTMSVFEYPGLSTTALDTSNSASATSSLITVSLTPAGAGELVFALGYDPSNATGVRVGVGDDWTCRLSQYDNATFVDMLNADMLTRSASAVSSGFSLSGSHSWGGVIVAFKNMGPAVASTSFVIGA